MGDENLNRPRTLGDYSRPREPKSNKRCFEDSKKSAAERNVLKIVKNGKLSREHKTAICNKCNTKGHNSRSCTGPREPKSNKRKVPSKGMDDTHSPVGSHTKKKQLLRLQDLQLAHFLHPAHKLTELNDETPYRCDGCKIVGNGTRFSCVSCQFDLHVYCAKCPTMLTSTTNHPHTMSLVVYKPKPNQIEPCQICRNPILGLVYECKSCSFLVHPLCVSRNSGLNQGSAIPTSSSTTQGIGEQIAVGLATNYIYDTITKDEDEEPTADSDALGNDEESGSFFDGFDDV
nr:zinc finger, PHD-type, conserved site [Tanacetum cinerariifolium]GEX50599.1 zinc finger, PHD-type, conserved site [Tanacetum cinerariifolium]